MKLEFDALELVAPAAPHPEVRMLADPGELRDPILIAAFSGPYGASAAATVAYLAEQWEARPVAEIDAEAFYDFAVQRPSVRLADGARVIDWPENRFFVARPRVTGRDIVLLAGVEPNYRWRTFCEAVARTAEALGVTEAVTLGVYRSGVPHTRPAPVRLLGGDEEMGQRFGLAPAVSDYQGPVGIATVLGEHLRAQGLRVGALTAFAPFYVGMEPEPHAINALIDVLDRGLGTETDRERVLESLRAIDEQARHAMARSERFRAVLQQLEEQYDRSRSLDTFSQEDTEHLIRDVEEFFAARHDGQRSDVQPSDGRGEGARDAVDRQA